jgi:hypothetical protein
MQNKKGQRRRHKKTKHEKTIQDKGNETGKTKQNKMKDNSRWNKTTKTNTDPRQHIKHATTTQETRDKEEASK